MKKFDKLIEMVQVGQKGITYVVPKGWKDEGRENVDGGFLMSTEQTTYLLWYEGRAWAEDNGYYFQNLGVQGSEGDYEGDLPSSERYEPVTCVSWLDVIVWLNAISEMTGQKPVYTKSNGEIIKDSSDANAVDDIIITNNNGYRLPTFAEWEMAARWRNESGDGSISVGGRYWTPYDYASGAMANSNDKKATSKVAWYFCGESDLNKTRMVAQLSPNHLGIYDMSGNVSELTITKSGCYRFVRGGSYDIWAGYCEVGMANGYAEPLSTSRSVGFRIVKN